MIIHFTKHIAISKVPNKKPDLAYDETRQSFGSSKAHLPKDSLVQTQTSHRCYEINCLGAYFPYPVRKAWRVMRITTLLILVVSLHLSAKTTAQKITLNSNDISIEQFFKQLKKQTGYSFLLENGVISKDEKISVNVKDASLEMVLDQILKPINLIYKIENKTVFILKDPSKGLMPKNGDLPPIEIRGRVTDSLGNPLPGVSIIVKGGKMGTSTDVNGYFTLPGVSDNATLIISNVGYEQQSLKLKGKK